tara:strand:- start:2819 stop:3652 length:834 start_codon:yes stop_codon:yes gene_type:complete
MNQSNLNLFSLKDKVIIITGGAGLLGEIHSETVLEADGISILLDINKQKLSEIAKNQRNKFGDRVLELYCDITSKKSIRNCLEQILKVYGRIDGLINNAANDPKADSNSINESTRFENISFERWEQDISVGLTGAFFCCQVFGEYMSRNNGGVIINIASDLSIISPDQRLYKKENIPSDLQPVKPITYSVVKSGILGLTKYLSTYWATKKIRVNAISPGGVYNNQSDEFLARISERIPLQRMASPREYKGSMLYLLTDASSYMTGSNLIVDGGRTVW